TVKSALDAGRHCHYGHAVGHLNAAHCAAEHRRQVARVRSLVLSGSHVGGTFLSARVVGHSGNDNAAARRVPLQSPSLCCDWGTTIQVSPLSERGGPPSSRKRSAAHISPTPRGALRLHHLAGFLAFSNASTIASVSSASRSMSATASGRRARV